MISKISCAQPYRAEALPGAFRNPSGPTVVNRWATRATPLNLVALTLGVAVPITLMGLAAHFYAGWDVIRAVSFWADETTLSAIIAERMDTAAPALIGKHLFGDFAIPYYWVSLADPWSDDPAMVVDYLPPVLVFFKVLAQLGPIAGLVVYLTLMCVALLLPCWIALSGRPLATRIIVMLITGLCSAPALASLDRGNTGGFIPILIFGVAVGMMTQRWNLAVWCLVGAILLKAAPAVLLLIFLARGRWRSAALVVGICVMITLVCFPLVTSEPLSAIDKLLTNMLSFGVVETSYETFMSYNVSMLGGISQVSVIAGLGGLSTFIWEQAGLLCALYILVVTPLFFVRTLDLWFRIILAMSCCSAAVPIAYPYSLNWCIAAAAVLCWVSRGSVGSRHLEGRAPATLVTAVLVVIALLAAPMPFFIPGSESVGHPAGMVAVASASVGLFLPILGYAFLLRSRAQKRSGAGEPAESAGRPVQR